MATEERLLRLENAFATLSELVAAAESHTEVLIDLVRRQDDRSNAAESRLDQLTELAANFDERVDTLMEAQANSEAKIAALADAQIRTEEALARLAEAQADTEQRLKRLISFVSEGRNGHS